MKNCETAHKPGHKFNKDLLYCTRKLGSPALIHPERARLPGISKPDLCARFSGKRWTNGQIDIHYNKFIQLNFKLNEIKKKLKANKIKQENLRKSKKEILLQIDAIFKRKGKKRIVCIGKIKKDCL